MGESSPDLAGGFNVITRILTKRRQEAGGKRQEGQSPRKREDPMQEAEVGVMQGHKLRNVGSLEKPEKAKQLTPH